MGDASNKATSAFVAQVPEEDDEVSVGRGEGGDVVPFVVGV